MDCGVLTLEQSQGKGIEVVEMGMLITSFISGIFVKLGAYCLDIQKRSLWRCAIAVFLYTLLISFSPPLQLLMTRGLFIGFKFLAFTLILTICLESKLLHAAIIAFIALLIF